MGWGPKPPSACFPYGQAVVGQYLFGNPGHCWKTGRTSMLEPVQPQTHVRPCKLSFHSHRLHDPACHPFTPAAGLYAAVVVWALWIAASRLYLGLHSPIDILTGAIAGLTIVGCFIHVEGVRGRLGQICWKRCC